jgi:hypothetical protein
LNDNLFKTELSKLESSIEALFTSCCAAEHLTPEFHYLSACLLVDKLKIERKTTKADDPNRQKAFEVLGSLLDGYTTDSVFLLNVSQANLNIINILCEKIDSNLLFEYNKTLHYSFIQMDEYYKNTNQMNPKMGVSLGKRL